MYTSKRVIFVILIFVFISCSQAGDFRKLSGYIDVVKDCHVKKGVDSTSQLENCLLSVAPNSTIYFEPGKYKFNRTLVISNNYITLMTSSYGSAELEYYGCGAALEFSKGTLPIYQVGIKYLRIKGIGACEKTGIIINDGRRFTISESEIIDFNIGIINFGRERFNLRDAQISANFPIVFGRNPNHGNIDVDHAVFYNLYCIVQGNNYCITIRDGVTVTNMVMSGSNAIAKGCGIIKWITKTLPQVVSQNIKLSNIRSEQNQAGCDKPIHIDLSRGRQLQNLIIDNVRLGGPFTDFATGIYVRNVQSLTIRNSTYANNSPSVFIDSGQDEYIELQNNFSYLTSDINTGLVWIDGPFRGKNCCIDGLRSIVSGKLSK